MPLKYFLSPDLKTQIAFPMDDALHAHIWGRMTVSNQPYPGAERVEVEDGRGWIEAQMAVQVAKAEAQRRMVLARCRVAKGQDAQDRRRAA